MDPRKLLEFSDVSKQNFGASNLNEHSLYYYSLIIILSAPPIASPPLSLLARSRHAGRLRDRSPCSNLKVACEIEATIFKLQFYPDGGHILEENKNKMSIFNIFFFSNCNVINLKSAPPVLSCLSICVMVDKKRWIQMDRASVRTLRSTHMAWSNCDHLQKVTTVVWKPVTLGRWGVLSQLFI